jgi:hypothetical protein
MKTKDKTQGCPVSGPLLENIKEQEKANLQAKVLTPTVGSTPLDPPDLYQDPGNGYNKNLTYPQK